MAALILTEKISQSTTGNTEARTLTVRFGNGYEQRAKDGINNIVGKWSLAWDNINITDLQALVTFFSGLNGVDYFTWQAPTSASTMKWVQDGDWSVAPKGGNVYTFSVSIRQVFDL